MIQKVIYDDGMKAPLKIWANNLDEKTIEQAKNVCKLPFIYKWISIMPDGHYGYGVPIGSVIPALNYIIPNAVGSDIGCGMCAFKTNLKVNDIDINDVLLDWQKRIPVGKMSFCDSANNMQYRNQDYIEQQIDNLKNVSENTDGYEDLFLKNIVPEKRQSFYDYVSSQLGTLGDGNHFCELQKDENDTVWIMIHSGSRNFGGTIGKIYHKIAVDLCQKYHSRLDSYDLAFLPLDSLEGESYKGMMNIAVHYAFQNRQEMMNQAISVLGQNYVDVESHMINIAHNYAALENHYGKNVMVHRKGATCVRQGTIGIIPGSMTTHSYIVKGKGNLESFHSCSHGSGRLFGRTEAKKRIDNGIDASQEDQIRDANISVYGSTDVRDEVGTAYKDINDVMNNQLDLVEIVHKLIPLAVLKG